MRKRCLAWLLVALSGAAGTVRSGAQSAAPSPLAGANAAVATVPGGWLAEEAHAAAALQAGFSATAAAIDREVLEMPALPETARQRVTLGLVSALMEQGDEAAAAEVLGRYTGPRTIAYQLRAGLLAANARRLPQAKAAIEAGGGKVDELAPAERGWWYYLQMLVAEQEGDTTRRNALSAQAEKAAVSEMQRARFVLGLEQARMASGQANEQRLATLRANMANERVAGTSLIYDFVRTYAAELVSLGRKAEAQAEVQRQLDVLPTARRTSDTADQLRLLLGLIAEPGSTARRQAFRQLLREGRRTETQQMALYAWEGDTGKPDRPEERELLRRELAELIARTPDHPVLEDLLVVHAQAALADKLFDEAELDAQKLLERFPVSRLKPAALGVQVTENWDLKRYRKAAETIGRLRDALAAGRERASLGVLLAEAYFRAGVAAQAAGASGVEDYRNAADAYEAVLAEAPADVAPGVLLFQRVLSDIRAERLDRAQQLLDAAAATPAFDAENRWQGEWNLVKELQVRNRTADAYVRINRLLGGADASMPGALRTRMRWLQSRLAFDSDKPAVAVDLAGKLQADLQKGAASVEPELKNEVVGSVMLIEAQSLLALGKDGEGGKLLERLRADLGATKASQESYIVQAARLSQKGAVVEAQSLLKKLADDHRDSGYAPLALYEAALIAERLGLDRNLEDAYNLLGRLCTTYPKDPFVFYARLRQGDLLRRRNDLGAALRIYDDLVNNFAQHPEVVRAEIAQAECLYAQSSANVTNFEKATAIYERLSDRVAAPVDLRVEAGYRLGYALAKRGQTDKARAALFTVVDKFLLDAAQAEKLGAQGRWWMARTLLDLGQIHEDLGQYDDAVRYYRLIIDRKLGPAEMAAKRLANFRPAEEVK